MTSLTILDRDIIKACVRGAKLRGPRKLITSALMVSYQFRQSRRRSMNDRMVPASIIISLTKRCNLKCQGCYHLMKDSSAEEMDSSDLLRICSEFEGMGTSIFVLAGGEPMMRWPVIKDMMSLHTRALFVMFTNGTLIDENVLKEMRDFDNLLLVLSQEGSESATDLRRGSGVGHCIKSLSRKLRDNGILFGYSITVHRGNVRIVTSDQNYDQMISEGASFISFVEYVPMQAGTESMTLTDDNRTLLISRLRCLRHRRNAVVLGFPGDEERFNGCLAAGRGFLHISPSGNVEACPAAPFSDRNLLSCPADEAVMSPLMTKLRDMHASLKEGGGGCALWSNKEEVSRILATNNDS